MKSHLAPLSRYWSIIRFKTYANLKRDMEKTYLGSLWWILEPLLNTTFYYIIVSYVFGAKTPPAFILVGSVIYGHISMSINAGAGSLVANASLMQQMQLPKQIYPILAIANMTWKFLFSFLVILVLLWIFHYPPHLSYLALPVLLAYQILFVVSLAMPLSILTSFFRDARTPIATALNAGLWFSGVFFPATWVGHSLRPFFYLNPAASLIEAYRAVLLEGRWPLWHRLAIPAFLCLFCLAAGFWLIKKLGGKVTKSPV